MPRARHFAFVTDELPRPGSAGHLAYNHALIDHLATRGHGVDLYLTRPRLPSPVTRVPRALAGRQISGPNLTQAGEFLIATEPRAAAAALVRAVLPGILHGHSMQRPNDVILGAPITGAQSEWIGARIAESRPDAILIDTIFRAPLLDRPELAGLRSVLVTHDLFHRRHAALSLAGYRVAPARLDRQDEQALLARADALVAIQPQEAALLRAMCPDRTVVTVPMPATPKPRPHTSPRNPDRLVFIGSDTLPNLDGLRWFFAHVWPGLRAARPNIRLDLVGDCGSAIGRLPAGSRQLGRVADLSTSLHRAALAIAPLRTGSGLKVKLLDYARHGLWTVATSEAGAGIAHDDRPPIFIADTPSGFGATILAALTQQPDDDDAISFIARHYAPEQVFGPVTSLLDA